MATLQVKVTTQYYMTTAAREPATFAFSHKITEQTMVGCHIDCNDLIIFFPPSPCTHTGGMTIVTGNLYIIKCNANP